MQQVFTIASILLTLACPFQGTCQEELHVQEHDSPVGVIEDPTADDTSMPWLEWFQDANQATLSIRGLEYPGIEYWLHFQASFGPYVYSWDDGPYEVGPLETCYIDIELPPAAYFNRSQLDYTTVLNTTLWVVHPHSGERLQMLLAPELYFAFEEDGQRVVYMSADEAALLAPLGAYSNSAQSRLLQAGLAVDAESYTPDGAILTGISPVIVSYDSEEDFDAHGPIRE